MEYDYRRNPILGAALAYWHVTRRQCRIPARSDIDATEIPALLAHLHLIDVVESGTRFRYRLIGTEIVRAFGRDHTGKHVNELFSGKRGNPETEIAGHSLIEVDPGEDG